MDWPLRLKLWAGNWGFFADGVVVYPSVGASWVSGFLVPLLDPWLFFLFLLCLERGWGRGGVVQGVRGKGGHIVDESRNTAFCLFGRRGRFNGRGCGVCGLGALCLSVLNS